VFANAAHSESRDRVDDTARQEGWQIPEWYLEIKAKATPILGTARDMGRTAQAAGLIDVAVDECAIDVGVTEPEQLVEYRFGQAQFTTWLDQIGARRAQEVRRRATDAVRPIMRPYLPTVVFLSALRPER